MATRTVRVAAVSIVLAVGLIVLRPGRSEFTMPEDFAWSRLVLDPAEGLLVLAPHPDDEAPGLPVLVVVLTWAIYMSGLSFGMRGGRS